MRLVSGRPGDTVWPPGPARAGVPEGRPPLSGREHAVLVAYASGQTLHATARQLGISVETARTYLKRAKAKYQQAGVPVYTKLDLAEQVRSGCSGGAFPGQERGGDQSRRPGSGHRGEASRAAAASVRPGIITDMRVLLASEPGGAGRPNEDFVAAVPGAVVLLDGAGYEPPSGIGCVHGIAWYARTLGSLLAAGACDDRVPLAELLGRGIEQVSRMHSGTCDLSHPATPGATVIIARQRGGTLEYLVLCDSVLLLVPRQGGTRALTDTRLGETMARFRPDAGLAPGSPEHDAAWRAYSRELEAARNRPGGFWLAAADPGAAGHALTGAEPLASLSAVALLSDGASRLADRFHLATWAELVAILAGDGPGGLIRRVRAAESTDPRGERWPRGKIHDDATAVFWAIPG